MVAREVILRPASPGVMVGMQKFMRQMGKRRIQEVLIALQDGRILMGEAQVIDLIQTIEHIAANPANSSPSCNRLSAAARAAARDRP